MMIGPQLNFNSKIISKSSCSRTIVEPWQVEHFQSRQKCVWSRRRSRSHQYR